MKLFQALRCGLLFAAACSYSAGATTYFVSPSGSDSNNGMSTDQAWQTLARLNQANIAGGDTVLLEGGGVWHEQLTVQGGSPGAPVTYGAYDSSGSAPVIDGADAVSGLRIVATDTFEAAFAGQVGKVFVGTQYLQDQTPLQQVGSRDDCFSQPGTYFADGSTLLVHTAPQGDGLPTIEVTSNVRRHAMENRGGMYVVVQDLGMVRTYNSAFISRPSMTNQGSQHLEGSNITVQRCQFYNYGSASDLQHNDYVEDAGEGGIYIGGFHDNMADQEQPLPNILVLYNKLGRFDSHGTIDYDRAGIYIRNTTGAIVRGNYVATQTAMGIRLADNYNNSSNDSGLVDANIMVQNQGNISIAGCSRCSVTGNMIQDSSGFGIGLGRGLHAPSDLPQVIGNTIKRLRPSTDGVLYNGVDCNAGTTRGVARYNSISAVANYSFTLEADDGEPCSGWTLEQNTLDASQNVTFQGNAAGRVGCLFVQKLSLNGSSLQQNDLVANAAYPPCVSLGSDSTSDTSHDVTPDAVQ